MVPHRRTIPYFRPSISDEEIQAVTETLRSGWLTTGPKARRFEHAFARYLGSRNSIAVSSGTAALHLALEALGVGPGDEVIVPTMTFSAAAAVVVHLGARPVFVDCHPDTLNLNPDDLERKITSRTKVLAPVHFGGQPCQMDQVLEIARRHRLRCIEDAAHALPAQYGTRKIGTISDVTCFSFYANKTITTGEGGMVTTGHDGLARRMRLMAHHGIDRSRQAATGAQRPWSYKVIAPGYKSNMSDIAASLGIQQLRRCNDFWKTRQRCATLYARGLASIEAVQVPVVIDKVRHAWHMYVIQLQLDQLRIGRDEFSDRLNAAGIGTGVHYLPVHMHPYYRDTLGYQPKDLPIAAAAYDRILSLPIFPSLTKEDIDYIVTTVRSIAGKHRR
jgi:dTDP-4-amino-4,6-dideoxygalactose transaminase